MASSNRHWPSMFKSKPCNQPWHDINSPPLLSSACQKSAFSSGCEERSPEPKPRWNPKPEQIRILEAIFNSGMVNPPREEIHRIRVQLQQYGHVQDANVFYWFQNRKSRTKNKHRQQPRTHCRPSSTNINTPPNPSIANFNIDALGTGIGVGALNNTNSMPSPSAPMTVSITMTTPTSSSSSSSERSSGSSKPLKPSHAPMSFLDPVNHIYNNFHGSVELPSALETSFLFQNPHMYCFSIPELTGLIAAPEHHTGEGLGLWSGPMGSTSLTTSEEEGVKFKNDADLHDGLGLWNELINQAGCKGLAEGENGDDKMKLGLHHNCSFGLTNPIIPATVAESVITASVPAASGVANVNRCANMVTTSPVHEMQGFGNGGGSASMGGVARLTVFINDVAFDMPAARMNVKSVFGPNAILVHASGYPVPIDELANTLQPLQHGAAYYVV